MKLRLSVSEERYAALAEALTRAGFELDDDAELVLLENDRFATHLPVRDGAGNRFPRFVGAALTRRGSRPQSPGKERKVLNAKCKIEEAERMAHRICNLLRSLAICISCILLLAACSKPGSTETESSRKYDASAEEAEIHQKQLQNNEVIEEPLSEAEKLERSKQSQILQNGEFGDISEKTADTLADYFVRCQRLENPEGAACIRAARHEEEPQKPWTTHGTWEYWILTADTGTEYWLAGFTNSASDAFDVYFIYRDTLDGELLYGYYQ